MLILSTHAQCKLTHVTYVHTYTRRNFNNNNYSWLTFVFTISLNTVTTLQGIIILTPG